MHSVGGESPPFSTQNSSASTQSLLAAPGIAVAVSMWHLLCVKVECLKPVFLVKKFRYRTVSAVGTDFSGFCLKFAVWVDPSLLYVDANLKSRVHTVFAGELLQIHHSTNAIRLNSALRYLKFEKVLMVVVAVVGSSQTHSTPTRVYI